VQRARIEFKPCRCIDLADGFPERTPVSSPLKKSDIKLLGDVSWGTHVCMFYETEDDLLDTVVPYFKAGLESNEFCAFGPRVVTTPC